MTLDEFAVVVLIMALLPVAIIQWMSLIVAIIERFKEQAMTIRELYEYANANGFENLPLQYGFADDNGIYYPDYFGFADF